MKDPMAYIERFCYKHPNFGVKGLMRYIAAANIAFWLLWAVNPTLAGYLTFDPGAILHGQVWRLVTFALLPPSVNIIAFVAIYFYYWIGSTLENYWGTPQFNVFFLSGVVLTVIYGFIIYFTMGISIQLSAQYVFLSMFFSFAVMFPDMQVLLFFIIPVKMKYLAVVDAFIFILAVITEVFPLNLLPVVAVLNFFIFCGGELFHNIPQKTSKSAINFRRESRRIRKEQESKLYTHKCAVCGRTDISDPQLEFRYCSRCAGYHCFCSEHINNHIHFTE